MASSAAGSPSRRGALALRHLGAATALAIDGGGEAHEVTRGDARGHHVIRDGHEQLR